MAYTTLATQSAGQTASAAGWANVVKANFDAIGNHYKLRKASDQSVTSSVTLVNDTDLTFPIAANEIWIIEMNLLWVTGAGGWGVQVAAPSGATGFFSVLSEPTAGSPDVAKRDVNVTWSSGATYTDTPMLIKSIVVNGVTAGNCLLKWAQGASNGAASVLKANSYLLAHQMS